MNHPKRKRRGRLINYRREEGNYKRKRETKGIIIRLVRMTGSGHADLHSETGYKIAKKKL